MEEMLSSELNKQFAHERYSADVYNALACYFDRYNMTGFKGYMRKREAEERTHAEKFADYMADRNVLPIVGMIPDCITPMSTNPMTMGAEGFQMALNHEKTVTERINSLSDLAHEVNDPATAEFLLWFIHEQVEEERTLEEIITKFSLAAGNGAAILMLNEELGG